MTTPTPMTKTQIKEADAKIKRIAKEAGWMIAENFIRKEEKILSRPVKNAQDIIEKAKDLNLDLPEDIKEQILNANTISRKSFLNLIEGHNSSKAGDFFSVLEFTKLQTDQARKTNTTEGETTRPLKKSTRVTSMAGRHGIKYENTSGIHKDWKAGDKSHKDIMHFNVTNSKDIVKNVQSFEPIKKPYATAKTGKDDSLNIFIRTDQKWLLKDEGFKEVITLKGDGVKTIKQLIEETGSKMVAQMIGLDRRKSSPEEIETSENTAKNTVLAEGKELEIKQRMPSKNINLDGVFFYKLHGEELVIVD